MRDWLNAHKPAAPARLHLLLAAMMWTVVGGLLLLFGTRWVLGGDMPHAHLLLGAAVGAGLLKARLVLDRAAERIVEPIRAQGDGRCVGGFLSLWTWAFVGLMVAAGRFLRGGLFPRAIVGLVYAAVGAALLVAARRLWVAWRRHSECG